MNKERLIHHLENHIDFSKLPYNFTVLTTDGRRIEKKKPGRHLLIERHRSSQIAPSHFYKPVSTLF